MTEKDSKSFDLRTRKDYEQACAIHGEKFVQLAIAAKIRVLRTHLHSFFQSYIPF